MESVSESPGHLRKIRLWLIAVAGLTFIMVVVGGATRITESGLSIVEWQPVTGVLPPLEQTEWQREFEKYQATPQYRLLNRGMSLSEFKTIYWWEWTHRLLGRAIGAAFLLPFLFFLWRGWIGPRLRGRLWLIFALGTAQGAIGWWMVASGLAERTEVSQYRLATHLVLACVLFAACLFIAQRLALAAAPAAVSARGRTTATLLLGLMLLQIYFGALLAGLRGGLVYNTWPLIDGAFVPPLSQLFALEPAWRNWFENILTVQFAHRMTAYALCFIAVLHVADIWRGAGSPALRNALALAIGILIQASLGVLTLLNVVPAPLALLHQAMAVVVLALAVVHAERVTATRTDHGIRAAALPSAPRA